jgi:hypothetical protein
MLINARDPRQWTYLRNLPQKKRKKTLVLTNVGKRAVGGVLHTLRICGFEQFRTKKLNIKIRVFEN